MKSFNGGIVVQRKHLLIDLILIACLALSGCFSQNTEETLQKALSDLQSGNYRSAEITAKSLLQTAREQGDSDLQRASRLLLARTYYEVGDSANAARFYDALEMPSTSTAAPVYKSVKSSEEDWHRWLTSAWNANDAQLALAILKQPLAPFSSRAREIYQIRQLLAEGDSEDARSVLALTRAPGNTLAPLVRYTYALMLAPGDMDAALDMVEELIKEDPTFAEPQLLRARLLQAKGELEAALLAFRKYTELRPTDSNAQIPAALLAFQTGAYDQARELVNSLTGFAPENALVLQLRGMLAFLDKDYGAASEFAQQSLGAGLESFMNHLVVGVGAYQAKSWELANRHLAAINDRLPGDHFARKMLVETKLQLDESSQAAEIFRELDTESILDVALANRLSAKLIEQGGYDTAGIVQQQVANIAVDEGQQHLMQQRQLLDQVLKRNEFKQALIQSVHSGDPEDKDRLRLVLLHLADRETAKAETLVQEWLAKAPENVNALNAAALVEQRLGNLPRQQEYLAQSLAMDPDNIPAQVLQLQVYREQQRWPEVTSLAEKLMTQQEFRNPAVFNQWLEANLRLDNDYRLQAQGMLEKDTSGQLEPAWLSFLLRSQQFNLLESHLQHTDPQHWTPSHTAAHLLAASGRNDTALTRQRLEKLIESNHFSAQGVAQLSLATALRQKHHALVLRALARAGQLEIAIAKRDLIKATALIGNRQFSEAREALQQYAAQDAAFFEVSADLAAAEKDYQQAWQQLEKAAAEEITTSRLQKMFQVGAEVNKRGAVKDYIRGYFQAKPTDNLARRLISQWYMEDSPHFAIELLDAGPMQRELERDWVSTNNLAWLYHQVGDAEKARHYAEHAIRHAPERPEVIDTYETVFGRKPQN